MRHKLSLIVLLSIGVFSTLKAQVAHEIGITTGPVFIQSDFGQSGHTPSEIGNVGMGLGLVYFMDFSYNSRGKSFIKDHFKIKAELSYSKSNLEHKGVWVSPSKNSLMANQLRAMKGSVSLLNLGVEAVFFPLDLQNYYYDENAFSPYISAGLQINNFTPHVESDLGRMGVPSTTPVKYMNGYRNESGTTLSFVAGIGTRYRLNRQSDLMLEVRYQSFFSDWVDGLRPDPNIYLENKNNDSALGINLGYIFYLDY